jgi:hypothetical protein
VIQKFCIIFSTIVCVCFGLAKPWDSLVMYIPEWFCIIIVFCTDIFDFRCLCVCLSEFVFFLHRRNILGFRCLCVCLTEFLFFFCIGGIFLIFVAYMYAWMILYFVFSSRIKIEGIKQEVISIHRFTNI